MQLFALFINIHICRSNLTPGLDRLFKADARVVPGSRPRLGLTFTRVCACMQIVESTFAPSWSGIGKDGSGCLNIRIIRIRIRLKRKYGYPYPYSNLIWMSYGCIRIRFWELFSIRFHIRIRGISDHIRIRPYPQRKND